MEDTRHPVVRELVKAWDGFWSATSLGQNCVSCFSGKLLIPTYGMKKAKPRPSRGCCGGCDHLVDGVGCIAKPLKCAMYSCGSEAFMFLGWDKKAQRKITDFVYRLSNELYFKYDSFYFASGYQKEIKDGAKQLTPAVLDIMQRHTRSLKIMGKRFATLQPPRHSHFVPISALIGG